MPLADGSVIVSPHKGPAAMPTPDRLDVSLIQIAVALEGAQIGAKTLRDRIEELEGLNEGLTAQYNRLVETETEQHEDLGKVADALDAYLKSRGHSLRDTKFRDVNFQTMADILRDYS